MLTAQVARFALELSAFAAALPPAHLELAAPLGGLAEHLPALARGEPCVRRDSRLAEALAAAARLLAATRQVGAAPQRFVAGIERRLSHLYEVGVGLPTHQQRPRPQVSQPARSLRGPRRSPAYGQVAFG